MTNFSRRTLLAGTGAIALVAAAGCSAGGGGAAQAPSTTVRITLANHVWTENVKKAIPEFEKATGLKLEITQLAEDQLSDQYNVKLNAGTSEIDVMMYRPLQEGRLFAQNKYFADLTEKAKGDAAWNVGDFQASPMSATTHNGQIVGIPIITEREVLYYRKDVLSKLGIEVPKTLDELKAAAKKIKEAGEMSGFVARTGKSPAVTQFSSFLFSMGGDFVDAAGKASVNTDAAKQAYALYGELIREYGPANVSTDMSWPEAMAVFTQGQAAFYTEADSLYKNATDPAKSKVSDTVGFAQFPAGPGGSKPYNIPSWALGVNAASTNVENAWKFIQWATSKEQVAAQQKSGIPGARSSVWESADGISSYPTDLAKAITDSAKVGVDHDRPVVAQVVKAREAVGQPIVDSIKGGDLSASVETAQKAFQAVLDAEKK
ncbi:sugar ABC transporter substrate-binding protein [Propioniciclava coleopterorum]|uniref:Sugar ABC transporter substrate-binding protein n=1 Tax=Propioniciclava coleopterorum TaxID=2714937 RepID=A0A6G7Y4S1_9ACTN|nr:sugar ABC transporter substrate-binding protein [Propioniciclava coleopterorum]QIK71617.1 sugar ABC transporter substrate-binding protein [Propioniciclava coleopterorum]